MLHQNKSYVLIRRSDKYDDNNRIKIKYDTIRYECK